MAGTQSQERTDNYHHGDLRNALIIAAAELIEESGSDDFAMVDAARRAGVSSAAPYRHFRDREDLLWSVAELGFYEMARRTRALDEHYELGTIECIVESGKCYIEFVTSKPAFFDLMWGELGIRADAETEKRHSEVAVNGFYALVEKVQAWCDSEGVSADAIDLSMKLWALAMGLSHLAINNHIERFVSGLDPYEMLTSSTHSFLRGVKEAGS